MTIDCKSSTDKMVDEIRTLRTEILMIFACFIRVIRHFQKAHTLVQSILLSNHSSKDHVDLSKHQVMFASRLNDPVAIEGIISNEDINRSFSKAKRTTSLKRI